ncbi:hypothetical protein LIER_39770 [Lithospermum erythrorhizon]|uniref:Uncharacterized protein n=1 Tax=Lithospermum erythrorhizon TaxID=34254 RepID=A0AAV3QMB3_LITER
MAPPVTSVTGGDVTDYSDTGEEDTTQQTYWVNWRFFLCALWILIAVVVSLVSICKNEGFCKSRNMSKEVCQQETAGTVYMEDTWKSSCKCVHPGFLLCYRLIAFCVLLTLITSDIIANSPSVFYFYTEWTFTLVTIYFGLASLMSVYGCCHGSEAMGNGVADIGSSDPERGTYIRQDGRTAGFWGYTFQILYQTCAGAVTLTDAVFWLVIYPFLLEKDFKLNLLIICMHTVNAGCFLGDLIFNNLQFPFFRIAYFLLWTCIFVFFQWIFHTRLSKEWPYPFLDISSDYAPLWYLGVGLLHLPCFGTMALIAKTKQCCLSRTHSSYSSAMG